MLAPRTTATLWMTRGCAPVDSLADLRSVQNAEFSALILKIPRRSGVSRKFGGSCEQRGALIPLKNASRFTFWAAHFLSVFSAALICKHSET